MKTGFLQFKPEFGNPQANAQKVYDVLKDKEFDLIVLPELANSGYLFSDFSELEQTAEELSNKEIVNGVFSKTMFELCKKKNAYIVSGICEKSDDKFFNSSVLYYPNGEYKVYRKIHLFDSEKKWFTPGDIALEVHDIGKCKVGMMVCFDWIFPETARTLALKGAQIICHPSNLVMPYCQKSMFVRALENHVFTITANRIGKDVKANGDELYFTGESVMLSPKGKYLARASKDKEECTIAEVNPDEASDKNINGNNNLFDDRRSDMYDLSVR